LYRSIDKDNEVVYLNLVQAYEAEFSDLTKEVPDESGLFKVQTTIDQYHSGYLVYDNIIPVGFVVFTEGEVNDVAEFYIIPSRRHKGFGKELAHYTFKRHPGKWQVRQIEGAAKATAFWRKTIEQFTNGKFHEDIVDDEFWGKVTRQVFEACS